VLLKGIAGLYAHAASLLRHSVRLRHSLYLWSACGLILGEALSLAIALLHGSEVPLVAAATVAWSALITFILFGGAALLNTPQGVAIDRYGVPNGLTALRAYFCVPLLFIATLSLPGRLPLALWCGVGGAVGLLDAVDGIIARRFGPITVLGKALDPFMDALFFIIGAVGSFALSILPLWVMTLVLLRYAAPVMATPLVLLTGRRPELVYTSWGRRNTQLTGVVFFTLFWVRLGGGPVQLAALFAALPTLVPTTVLHFVALARRAAAAPRLTATRASARSGSAQ
jgi:phosphatidylglycerophosphate synthase